ncbi:hypothetical protein KIW84_043914 [Lathyrus oleraceus]|uniref:Uncharacterized protein n=1 Tax=Pisum sativum TaxID=3888 RepID=A0A9D4XH05_PEA|nr:hypothetical protein KIW84_043914 [Pisum sativum]
MEASDTAVPAPTIAQNDVVNNGRPVRQRALPHRLRDYERFQDNKVNNDGDFVYFALMAESEPNGSGKDCHVNWADVKLDMRQSFGKALRLGKACIKMLS